MSNNKGTFHALIALSILVSLPAHGALVSYFLDQSNEDIALSDGTNYLRVDIEDVADDIRFTVNVLDALLLIAGPNFGIQSFGFNFDPAALGVLPTNISSLPTGWTAGDDENQDGFGEFDLAVSGTGSTRQSPTLQFFITGIAGDTPESYAAASSDMAGQGNVFFAAHVADYSEIFSDATGVDSAFFGGSTLVPLPGALPLLLTGLAGLVLVARRRRSAAAGATAS